MGYSKGFSLKPYERASKTSHHHIVKDPSVLKQLANLDLTPSEESDAIQKKILPYVENKNSRISNIVAVDAGYTEITIRAGFPKNVIYTFQFGALLLNRNELLKLNKLRHIAPNDMAKLYNNINRFTLILPTKNVRIKGFSTLQQSVRYVVHSFFASTEIGEYTLLDTLKWFVFKHYKNEERMPEDKKWELKNNPLHPNSNSYYFDEGDMSAEGTFVCPITGGIIYLTDIFGFHEIVHEKIGASAIVADLANIIEHFFSIHTIKHLILKNPEKLFETLFVMDRPTAFFGQTSKIKGLMQNLISWLLENHQIYLVGIEKSGAFVDHAFEIRDLLKNGSILMLSDSYIYSYISEEKQSSHSYAESCYYGQKIIFKTPRGHVHVLSIPVSHSRKEPQIADFPNLQTILTHIDEFHCNMYDSSIIPIALINKLISLSTASSGQILKSFVRSSIGG